MARDRRTSLAPGAGPRLDSLRLGLPSTPLTDTPSRRAALQTELLHGQRFEVHARKGGFLYGRAKALRGRATDYVGWVPAKGMVGGGASPTHYVSALSAPVFSRAELKSRIVMHLSMGARVAVIGERDGYHQIGAGAWVSDRHVRPLGERATDPVAVARQLLGQAYVWGGTGARGLDCSGLVQRVLDACGLACPRDADQQERALGESVPIAEIAARSGQPGDLLFWPGHVGMLATRSRLIHANAWHMGVVEEPLLGALRRMEESGVTLRSARRLD